MTATRTATDQLAATQSRFWSYVIVAESCWLWTGSRTRFGYGKARSVDGRTVNAHRLAYQLTNGPIAPGVAVCHTCDNRLCVRPSHLFLGSIADNNADRDAKGRTARGERQWKAKLDESDVREIRSSSESQRALGRQYGVDKSTIAAIRRGESWKHVA